MKNKIIFMIITGVLYAILGYGQLPNATISVADHIMQASTWDQFMPYIAVDKNNAPNLLVTYATTNYALNGQCCYQGWQYFRQDGSITPVGNTTAMPNSAQSHGNSCAVFDANGQGYLQGLNGDQTGFFAVRTTDQCNSWISPTTNTHIATSGCETPQGTADDVSTSPHVNNYYAIWTDGADSMVKTTRSLDGGVTFNTTPIQLSDNFGFGPNIQTGPEGNVYACWSGYNSLSNVTPGSRYTELIYPADAIGFARSTDGGATYALQGGVAYHGVGQDAYDVDPTFGTYVNGFPSMAVDKSCEPSRRGRLYIVAATQSYSPAFSKIVLWFSDNGGNTFSGPITVSRSDQQYCWFPWVAVDDLTGVISVVYFGNDGTLSNTNTWVSFSDPTDATVSTWGNIKVSSATQTPYYYTPNSHLQSTFAISYDYGNGIAAYGGHAYPVWVDRRSGSWQIWTADIKYDAPQLASSSTGQQICPPVSSLSSASNPFIQPTENFDAGTFINVTTCGSGVLSIGSATNVATVNMKAGQFIQIGQGFVIAPGSVFTAEVGSTGDCQTPGVQSFKTNSTNTASAESIVTNTNVNGVNIYCYPNPASNQITVGTSNNNYQSVTFSMSDLSGRIIAQYNDPMFSTNGVSQIIDVSKYIEGLYIVTMTADNQKYSFKFAKQ